MDAAREWSDEQLEALERRMASEYAQAAREMRGRQERALREYARELEQRERALDDAPDAMAAHEAWLRGQAAKLTRLGAMADQLAAAASAANRRASDMVNDSLPGIFAENANRAAFEVDGLVGRDTAFSLVDESTVRHLMGLGDRDVINREVVYEVEPGMEAVQSIRRAEFEEARDIRWNRQKFNSAITQGILQGEGIPDIVRRTDEIFNSNRKAAVRAARTACTSAENAGRVSSYRRADRLGIPLVQEWMATLDTRTRSSHRALDGEQVEVDGEFSNGCRYPGDPHGPASEVWNCRCTIRARIEGFEDERQDGRWSRLPEGTTYEEWKAGKPVTRAASEPLRGAAAQKPPARTEYTMAELRGMGRPELERVARAVAAEHAPAQGISEAEALRRFDMLVDGNSDAQLRKYINQHGKTPGAAGVPKNVTALPANAAAPKNKATIFAGAVREAMTDTRSYRSAGGSVSRAESIARAEKALADLASPRYPSARDHNGKQAILVLSSRGYITVGASALSHIEYDHPDENGRPGVTVRGIIDSIENPLGPPTKPKANNNGEWSFKTVGISVTSAINPDTFELVTAWETEDEDIEEVKPKERHRHKKR